MPKRSLSPQDMRTLGDRICVYCDRVMQSSIRISANEAFDRVIDKFGGYSRNSLSQLNVEELRKFSKYFQEFYRKNLIKIISENFKKFLIKQIQEFTGWAQGKIKDLASSIFDVVKNVILPISKELVLKAGKSVSYGFLSMSIAVASGTAGAISGGIVASLIYPAAVPVGASIGASTTLLVSAPLIRASGKYAMDSGKDFIVSMQNPMEQLGLVVHTAYESLLNELLSAIQIVAGSSQALSVLPETFFRAANSAIGTVKAHKESSIEDIDERYIVINRS